MEMFNQRGLTMLKQCKILLTIVVYLTMLHLQILETILDHRFMTKEGKKILL